MTSLTAKQANERLIKREDYVSCSVAFIDCKKPGSHLKENYSIIGPGVTSSADQIINLPEPHGFNVGAAAMPNGITNNLHIHFTAEVFIVQKGEWTFRWGSNGEHSFVGKEGDILSVPTWMFRGFTNAGCDDGWLFTVLGGNNTGGVIFHPDIIREAEQFGLYISKQNTLIDTTNGDPIPKPDSTTPPMPDEFVAQLRDVSPESMQQRLLTESAREFRAGFIDASLPDCGAELAPVIGAGLTQNREHHAPITNPHGFSLEWLRMQPKQQLSAFLLDEKMVLIMRKGAMRVFFNTEQTVYVDVNAWDTYSIPEGVVRSIQNLGGEVAEALIVVSGDHRKYPEFSKDTHAAAAANDRALDAGGFVAPACLLPSYAMAKA